jgi:outer membrane lipoprotein SlyB
MRRQRTLAAGFLAALLLAGCVAPGRQAEPVFEAEPALQPEAVSVGRAPSPCETDPAEGDGIGGTGCKHD